MHGTASRILRTAIFVTRRRPNCRARRRRQQLDQSTRHQSSGAHTSLSSAMNYAFPPPSISYVPVQVNISENSQSNDSNLVFPVHRIYCVAKNYAEHIREMGDQQSVDKQSAPPVFFTKPADAVVHVPSSPSPNDQPITSIPYPLATTRLDHEIELVVAIGRDGGTHIPASQALAHVFGYAVGVDLTRRDLQAVAKRNGHPWDMAKAFDQSAPIGTITQKYHGNDDDLLQSANIWLDVNGTRRQQGCVSDMIWSVPEIIAALSTQFHLQPGDLIFTGTPSGIGPLVKGDVVTGGIDGLASIEFSIA